MEVGDGDGTLAAVCLYRFDHGIQRSHGDRHVARMGGDAGVARADDGVLAGEAADGRTAAAWLTLVARLVRVVEVRTARALQEVPRRRRLVAELTGSARDERSGQELVISTNGFVCRKVRVANQGSDTQSALRSGFNLVQSEAVHVDQMRRRLDLELHESRRLVPPAINFASGLEAAAWAAASTDEARS
ncbi:hypothetical protein AJ87_39470 [Rhizobium yanglingense]|nr:hypothetical protein AJ87_39470 [Rhizobium yanglingense]